KSVANRREELRRRSREAIHRDGQAAANSTLRHTDEGLYKKVVERLQLSRLLEDPLVIEKLAQAGFRGPRPVSTFYFFRFLMPFVMGGATAFYLFLINTFHLPVMSRICFSVFGLAAGYYSPNLFIKNVADKRRASIMLA